MVSPLLFGLLVVGVVWAWREGLRRERDDLTLLVCASVPVFLFFQVWSFFSKVQANWAAHAYLTAVVAAAGWCQTWMRTGVAPARPGNACIDTCSRRSCCRPRFSPWPSPRSSSSGRGSGSRPALDLVAKRLQGWPELGRAVGAAMATGPGAPFLVADHYQIASQLAFYVPGHPTVYTANFGRRMNQYDIWGGWEQLTGRDGVFVLQGTGAPSGDLREAFRDAGAARDGDPHRTAGAACKSSPSIGAGSSAGSRARPFAGY